jgi:hypothetical protein
VAALQLSNTDRSRRKKLVGMLGSAFEGERLKALRLQQMADAYKVPNLRIVARRRERRGRLKFRPTAGRTSSPGSAPHSSREASCGRSETPTGMVGPLRKSAAVKSLAVLPDHMETNFVADLITRGTRWPSPSQAVVIVRILEKAGAFSTASADADWEDVS